MNNGKKRDGYKLWYAISFSFQLGFMIAVPIVGFMLLGLFIDKKIHTEPIFLLVGAVVGIVVTVYEVRHLLFPIIKDD